jgi:hypothetical protein
MVKYKGRRCQVTVSQRHWWRRVTRAASRVTTRRKQATCSRCDVNVFEFSYTLGDLGNISDCSHLVSRAMQCLVIQRTAAIKERRILHASHPPLVPRRRAMLDRRRGALTGAARSRAERCSPPGASTLVMDAATHSMPLIRSAEQDLLHLFSNRRWCARAGNHAGA